MKRKVILLMAAIGAVLIVAGGVALAETVTCDATPPCYGTPEADQIVGTSNAETIKALDGDDFVFASAGNDTVYGEDGSDDTSGWHGDDIIYGGPGSDNELRGNQDSDEVYGGGGDDLINVQAEDVPVESTEPPVDYASGGRGNDEILAQDGNADLVICGKGSTDTVYYDEGIDTVNRCEIKNP